MKFARCFGKKAPGAAPETATCVPPFMSPEPAPLFGYDGSGNGRRKAIWRHAADILDNATFDDTIDDGAEGHPRTLLAGILVLVDGYRQRPSERLARCIANHFRDFADHRAADPVLREVARGLESEWRRLSGEAMDDPINDKMPPGENAMSADSSKHSLRARTGDKTSVGKNTAGAPLPLAPAAGTFAALAVRRSPLAKAMQSEFTAQSAPPFPPPAGASPFSAAKQSPGNPDDPAEHRAGSAGENSSTNSAANSAATRAAGRVAEKRNLGTRGKLWQLDHQYHCPVVGTCLPIGDLRALARRAGIDAETVGTMSDYALHVMMVGHAQERTPVAEAMQRELDRRYRAAISRFAPARDGDGLLSLWRDAQARGEVAAGLWAALTHPAAEKEVTRQIYGDIHMLSHQIGAGHRADLKRLAQLEDKCAALAADVRRERERTARRIGELETALAAREEKLAATAHALHEHAAARERLERELRLAGKSQAAEGELRRTNEMLERKLEAARSEITGLRRRLETHGEELEELRVEREAAESVLAAFASLREANGTHREDGCSGGGNCDNCPDATSAAARLDGRCLLCIGGREGLVDRYRGLVERCGGRFLHHDGGIEDNPKRLEATLASADAVVCQAGCVSHAAYWRLKEYCKRHNKPCVYLKRASVSGFARGIVLLAGEDGSARLN